MPWSSPRAVPGGRWGKCPRTPEGSGSGEESGTGSPGSWCPEVSGAVWAGHADGHLLLSAPRWAPQHLEGPQVLAEGSRGWRRVVVRSGAGPGWRRGLGPSWYRTHSRAGGSQGWSSSDQELPSGRRWSGPLCTALLHTQHKDQCREEASTPDSAQQRQALRLLPSLDPL